MSQSTIRSTTVHPGLAAAFAAAFALACAGATLAAGEVPKAAATPAKAAGASAAARKAFATPEELFQALADAAKANDSKALSALLGPGGDAVIHSGDAVADKAQAQAFATAYAAKHGVAMEGDAKATLVVGNDDWPMPIPATKTAKGWRLDTAAGAHELLARRIGQNELDVIQVVRAIVDAQYDYSSEDRDKDGLRDYASRFISTSGKRDGLYWPTKEGEAPSPLGPLVGMATAEGYKVNKGGAGSFHGYSYRLLTAQGKDAPGGARSYLAHGRLLGGFAVVAYPTRYGSSGIMTFIANQDGIVYQKDLGESTAAAAKGMNAYNPDSSWTAVK